MGLWSRGRFGSQHPTLTQGSFDAELAAAYQELPQVTPKAAAREGRVLCSHAGVLAQILVEVSPLGRRLHVSSQ